MELAACTLEQEYVLFRQIWPTGRSRSRASRPGPPCQRCVDPIHLRPTRGRDTVVRGGQEVDLVYMERMQRGSVVDDTPMVSSAYAGALHWTCSGLKFSGMDGRSRSCLCLPWEHPSSPAQRRSACRAGHRRPRDQETRCSRIDIDTFEPEGSGCGRSIRQMPSRIRAAPFQNRCDFGRLRSEVLFVHNTIQRDYESHDS